VEAIGHALLNQCPGEHVLGPVGQAADEPHRSREPDGKPHGWQAEAEALHSDGHQRSQGEHARRNLWCEDQGAQHHPHRPARKEQAVRAVSDLEIVLQEEDLGRRRGSHEQQGHEYDRDDEPERAVAEQVDDAIAGTIAVVARRSVRFTSCA
jgi:hypothetical protein